MWGEAEKILDDLCREAEEQGQAYNEGALCALVDAYNRCIEERRHAADLLELHRKWASRPIGGVAEPLPGVPRRTSGEDLEGLEAEGA